MKITSVNPGKVWYRANVGWTYNLVVNKENLPHVHEVYKGSGDAKQAMREQVAFLRKKHCTGQQGR